MTNNKIFNGKAFKLLEEIINKDLNINYQDVEGNTLLIYTSGQGITNIVELLLNTGADVNIKNIYNSTALMYASRYNNKEIVELLLKHNADVNIKNNNGDTALMYASRYGNIKLVDILIEYGALPVGITYKMLHKLKDKHEQLYKKIILLKKLYE
jgi:ankyrin repeat protein